MNATNESGYTALCLAVMWEHLETVRTLIRLGIDPNNTRDRIYVISVLVNKSPSLPPPTWEMVEVLVKNGANPWVLDKEGLATLLALPCLGKERDPEVVRKLKL